MKKYIEKFSIKLTLEGDQHSNVNFFEQIINTILFAHNLY